MNTIKRFFSYTEISTKITSVCTFLLVLAYLFANGTLIDPLRTLVFFAGMFLFDLTVTSINNYSDAKKTAEHLPFRRRTALCITFVLLALATLASLYLVHLTDLVVLALGGLCFLFGLMYSFGPVPISHGPYGEIVSGVFYGVFIPAILVYINTPPGQLLFWAFTGGRLEVSLAVWPAVGVLLLCVTPACLTADIMLANNICDVEKDAAVGRFTLAYYLKDKALSLFALLYYATYAALVALVVLGFVHPVALASLITIVPVQRNIARFFKKQSKSETFVLSIRNFLAIILAQTILIFTGGLLARLP